MSLVANNVVVVVGDGGHARSILSIETSDSTTIDGYCAPQRNESLEARFPVRYMGSDDQLKECPGVELVLGLSYLGKKVDLILRQKLIEKFSKYKFKTVVASSAIVRTDRIGQGTVVFEGAIINSGAVIGQHCVINTGAIVEHDCVVGDNVQISPGAIILGGAHIADHCFVGAGAVVRDSTYIKSGTIVAMGSLVVKNIE